MKEDLRKRRNRKYLRTALEELMLKKTYEDISIKEITDQAELNRTTFYLHFKNKEELLLYTIDYLIKEITESLPNPPEEMGNAIIDSQPDHIIKLLESIAKKKNFIQVAFSEKGVAPLIVEMFNQIAAYSLKRIQMIKRNSEAGFASDEIVAWFSTGSYIGLIMWWLNNDMPYSAKELAEILIRLLVEGIYPALGTVPPSIQAR